MKHFPSSRVAALAILTLLATSSVSMAQTHSCSAGDARSNTNSTPLRRGYDFVPITTDDSLGFYEIYSERTPVTGGNGVGNTAGIFLFEVGFNEILIFGAGYGNHVVARNNARFDVERVTEVVGGCLGFDPFSTLVHFATPHGHGDHVNAAFMKELEAAGYSIAEILYHQGDQNILNALGGWTTHLRNLWVPLVGGNPANGSFCGMELASYDTPLGKIWFVWRGGHHTNGGIDLVIDVRDNPRDRVLIQGSLSGGGCSSSPDGTRLRHKAHGNARVSVDPMVVKYGCGRNPDDSLVVLSGAPRLGKTVQLGVDNPFGSQAAGSIPYVALSLTPDSRYPCGRILQRMGMTGAGELLINRQAGHYLRPMIQGQAWAGPGSPAPVDIFIPNDPELAGASIYAQGVLWDRGAPTGERFGLTTGAELRIAP